jgi:hypothetical protein
MNKQLRYDLVPQMEIYDQLGYEWLPYLMFSQTPNYRSSTLNTDDRGYRFSHKSDVLPKSIFKSFNDSKAENNSTVLVLGNSFAFGVGATSDSNTVTGYLNKDNQKYLNLACRAHLGFQEIISVLSNIDKVKNVKKIVIISGIADFYLSKHFGATFPDVLYFYSEYITNMNKSRINKRMKFAKKILNFIHPNVLNDGNVWRLHRHNLTRFVTSKDFRNTFKKQEYSSLGLEEKLDRNFLIYKALRSYFNCEIEYYLNPISTWSKQMSNEEEQLFEYSKKYSSSLSKFVFDLLTKDNHEYISKMLSQLSQKHEINYFDANLYFRDVVKKDDWVYVDAAHCNDKGYELMSKYIESN